MQSARLYSVEEAFVQIDCDKIGYLSKLAEIDRFLRRNGSAVTNEDLIRIYRALNFKKDGEITYETFSEHLDPLQKGFYPFYKAQMIEKEKMRDTFESRRIDIESGIL